MYTTLVAPPGTLFSHTEHIYFCRHEYMLHVHVHVYTGRSHEWMTLEVCILLSFTYMYTCMSQLSKYRQNYPCRLNGLRCHDISRTYVVGARKASAFCKSCNYVITPSLSLAHNVHVYTFLVHTTCVHSVALAVKGKHNFASHKSSCDNYMYVLYVGHCTYCPEQTW